MKINGLEFNIEVTGEGVPFIWGHGLTGSMASDEIAPWITWKQLTDVVRLIRYDARGHGQSGASDDPADYHWQALARDMVGLTDQLGLESFVAGGGSMGCATAIYAALAVPHRIRGLVLMVPPTAWETRTAHAGNFTPMIELLETGGIAALAAMMAQQPASGPAWQHEAYPNMVTDFLAYLKTLNPNVLATVYRGAQRSNLPPRETLESIQAPALILAWADDPGHPLSSAEEIHRRLPNSRLVVARSARDVAAWTDTIRDFVTHLP